MKPLTDAVRVKQALKHAVHLCGVIKYRSLGSQRESRIDFKVKIYPWNMNMPIKFVRTFQWK